MSMVSKIGAIILALALNSLVAFSQTGQNQSGQRRERVLIKVPKPYAPIVARIESAGGRVSHQYEHIDAIAAEVPDSAMAGLRALLPANSITKDKNVPGPRSVDPQPVRALTQGIRRRPSGGGSGSSSSIYPSNRPAAAAYELNGAGLNLRGLHLDGKTGKGVIVAVVDSGMRPGFPALESDGSVIGGEDFVGDGNGFSNSLNDCHGTFVAGMISANVDLNIAGSSILPVIKEHLPVAIKGESVLPLIGSAPQASIYAIRIFPAAPLGQFPGQQLCDLPSPGAPESRIIAAIDRIIELRKRADSGRSGGKNIQVANLSLGTFTLEAGTDPLDLAVDALRRNDIVPVVAVGNVGPSSLTAASPASSRSSLSVAGASRTANERIYWDSLFGAPTGVFQRPVANTVQTALLSSRGPHADGRVDPDVIVNAIGNVMQGYAAAGDVSAQAGTSFATPIVAGVAAVLRQSFPRAEATEVLNAIVMSANPRVLTDGSAELDQGQGFVDAQAAFNLLKNGRVPDSLPKTLEPTDSVQTNVERGTDLEVFSGNVRHSTTQLKPGQRDDILYFVRPNTTQVVINISNFRATAPDVPTAFPDDLFVAIHSAETSSIGGAGDYYQFPTLPFTRGGEFTIPNPEPGVMRITIVGDSTNRGRVSADVAVFSDVDPLPRKTADGPIRDGEELVVPVTLPQGSLAAFELRWEDDWANYPTSDIDFFVFEPDAQTVHSGGNTLNHPERIFVNNPVAGVWYVLIKGFDIPAQKDHFKLRVTVDGKAVKGSAND